MYTNLWPSSSTVTEPITLCFSNGDNDDDLEIEVDGDHELYETSEYHSYVSPEQFEITEIRIKDTQAEICLINENDEIELSERVLYEIKRGY